MQATNSELDANQCLRCKRKPMKSIDTNVVY